MEQSSVSTKCKTLEEAIAFVLEKKNNKLVDSSVVGRWLFLVLKDGFEVKIVVCHFFKKINSDSWCFEWFDELNPPDFYGCPERILSQSTCKELVALSWRESCANKKATNSSNRNSNKEKYTFFSEMLDLNFCFHIESVGKVQFVNFYMNSKTQIIVRVKETGEQKKVRLSSIDYSLIEKSAS